MIFGTLLLALAWSALNGRLSADNFITGAVIGRIVLQVLAKGGVLPEREVGRAQRAVMLLFYLMWQIVIANLRIAMDVISLRNRLRPGVIRLPLDVTSDSEILLLTAMINITPGSVALDVSDDQRSLYVHVMHMANPDEAKRELKEGFERRVLELRDGVERRT